jgi:hypothetical protein
MSDPNVVTTKCCGRQEQLDEAHCSEHIAAVDLLTSVKELMRYVGGLPSDVSSSAPIDFQEMWDKAQKAVDAAGTQ